MDLKNKQHVVPQPELPVHLCSYTCSLWLEPWTLSKSRHSISICKYHALQSPCWRGEPWRYLCVMVKRSFPHLTIKSRGQSQPGFGFELPRTTLVGADELMLRTSIWKPLPWSGLIFSGYANQNSRKPRWFIFCRAIHMFSVSALRE